MNQKQKRFLANLDPKAVEFLSTLPRTGLGKIDREKLEVKNRKK
jgi:acyl-coenzyme A synthetase/AMP-(fatty) acid ligase